MSEKMKIFQKIQYVTVGIAFASIVLPLILLIFIPLVFMRYTLYNDYILVQCYIFGTERIPYESITSIKEDVESIVFGSNVTSQDSD